MSHVRRLFGQQHRWGEPAADPEGSPPSSSPCPPSRRLRRMSRYYQRWDNNNLAAVISAMIFIGLIDGLDLVFARLARRFDYASAAR
ncbi:MAG: hypothetical protein ACRDJ4_09370 [Actinomycetota bacterium]